MSKKTKILKLLVGLLSAGLLFLLIAVGLFLNNLPSAQDLKRKISGEQRTSKQPPKVSNTASEPVRLDEPVEKATALEEKVASNSHQRNDENGSPPNKIIEDHIFNDARPMVNVCEHLEEALHSTAMDKDSSSDFMKKLTAAAEHNDNDPFVSAVMAPIRYVVRLPMASLFFNEIRTAELNGEQGIINKASFYARGLAAYREIQTHTKELNDVAGHAYYLFLMGQIVRQNPQLLGNPELQSYCQQIQDGLSFGMPFNQEKQAERMQQFLEYAHVGAEQIGFDPKFKSEMNIEFTNHQFKVGLGWIGKFASEQ